MRRTLTGLMIVATTLGLAACVGATDPATNVRATQARLHAHGYTNDGPATWWWEYDTVQSELGTPNDTEVCGNPPEADNRCGPAAAGSQSNQIPLSVLVTGLTSDTTYYFRACGQDTNDPVPSCAQTRSFRTTGADSTASASGGLLTFTAPAVELPENHLIISRFVDGDGVAKYRLEESVSDDRRVGTSIIPGAGCQSFSGSPLDNAVKCPVAGITRIRALLNEGDDRANVQASVTIPSTLEGGPGSDFLFGSDNGDDEVITGPGGAWAFGANSTSGGGDDDLQAQNGVRDIVWCGNGNDVARVDVVDDSLDEIFGDSPYASCEQVIEF